MTDLLRLLPPGLGPWVAAIYALVFFSGGLYYLEQRVARTRDQFPERVLLARVTGLAALLIGALAGVAAATHLLFGGAEPRVAAVVAHAAGVAFWVCRLHIDLTPGERVRDVVLALLCLFLATVAWGWLTGPV